MKKLKENRGAAAVEFAIVLPLVLVLLFGIIEFSLILYDKAVITNASREGARQGIVFDSNLTDLQKTEKAETVAMNYCQNMISFSSSSSPAVEAPIVNGIMTVTVNYTYGFLLFPNLEFAGVTGGGIPISAVTVMRVEQ